MKKQYKKTAESLKYQRNGGFSNGGPEGVRTLGLCVANAALSQLSYGPKYKAQNPAGTEPLNAEPAL